MRVHPTHLYCGQVTSDILPSPTDQLWYSITIHLNDSGADLAMRGLDLFGKNKNPVTAPPCLHRNH